MKNPLSFSKRLFPLLLSVFACSAGVHAQSLQWARSIGGAGTDEPATVVHDAAGNVYTAGLFDGTADFDPGSGTYNMTPAGNEDGFICKLDASGNFVWAKQVGGVDYDYIRSVEVDAAGNLVIMGSFMGTVDFDPGTGVANLTASSNGDPFVLKLDAAGNYIWAKKIAGIVTANTTDVAGNIYVSGPFVGTVDFDPGPATFNLTSTGFLDIFVSKLDASGNFIWAKRMGGNNLNLSTAVAADKWGNVYTTGIYTGTTDFDPGTGVFNFTANGMDYDVFLTKFNASGDLVWARSVGSPAYDAGVDLALDTSGRPVLAGTFSDTMDFDPGAGVHTLIPSSSGNAFLEVFDTAGNFAWANVIGGGVSFANSSTINSIAIDSANNIIAGGLFVDGADFDPGAAVYNLLSAGDADMFVASYNSTNSNLNWVNQGGGISYDAAYGVETGSAGTVYVAGEFQSNSFIYGAATLTNSPGNDMDVFIVKLGACSAAPVQPSAINGPAVLCNNAANATFYAPAINGATSYTWTLPSGWTGSSTTNTINVTPGTTGGTISVLAANSCGSSTVQTLAVTLTPPPPATITVNDTSFCVGDSTQLQATTGTGYTYQWYRNSTLINGATNSSYYALVGGSYTVDVSNGCTVMSAPVSVTATVSLPAIQQNVDTLSVTAAFTTYQWYRNSTPISGATNQSFVATQSGSYFVVATNADGCTGMSNMISVIVSGIDDVGSQQGLSVYPNPTSGLVNVSCNSIIKEITVTDVVGRAVVHSAPNANKAVLKLEATGVYFIRVKAANVISTTKIIVNK